MVSTYSKTLWYFCVPTTTSRCGIRSNSSGPRLCAMQPMKPNTTCGFWRRCEPIVPILPSAFCSAWSRTEQVFTRIASASNSSPVTV